jgi:hypothetical protein
LHCKYGTYWIGKITLVTKAARQVQGVCKWTTLVLQWFCKWTNAGVAKVHLQPPQTSGGTPHTHQALETPHPTSVIGLKAHRCWLWSREVCQWSVICTLIPSSPFSPSLTSLVPYVTIPASAETPLLLVYAFSMVTSAQICVLYNKNTCIVGKPVGNLTCKSR